MPTLPWTFASGDTPAAGSSRLGVTLVGDSDLVQPTLSSVPLSTVLGATLPTYFPVSTAEPGEDPAVKIRILDFSSSLFATLAPPATDLPYLAQVREVTLETGTQLQSIVVGTCVASTADTYTAYLVSLDSYSTALPTSDGVLPATDNQNRVLADYTTFRLVVLAQWRFINAESSASFKDLAKGCRFSASCSTVNSSASFPIPSIALPTIPARL